MTRFIYKVIVKVWYKWNAGITRVSCDNHPWLKWQKRVAPAKSNLRNVTVLHALHCLIDKLSALQKHHSHGYLAKKITTLTCDHCIYYRIQQRENRQIRPVHSLARCLGWSCRKLRYAVVQSPFTAVSLTFSPFFFTSHLSLHLPSASLGLFPLPRLPPSAETWCCQPP